MKCAADFEEERERMRTKMNREKEDIGYQKEYVFTEMSKNGKLDKIIMEAQDKKSNPFLTLPYGNVYSTGFLLKSEKKEIAVALKNIRRSTA